VANEAIRRIEKYCSILLSCSNRCARYKRSDEYYLWTIHSGAWSEAISIQKKHAALAAVRRAYRNAGLRLGEDFEEGARISGQHRKERFDFIVANGSALQLTQTWSFEVPNQEDLSEQVKAWAWTVKDVRDHGGIAETEARRIEVPQDVDIQVVYVPPSHNDGQALKEVLAAFGELGVQHVEADSADQVGQQASRLVKAMARAQQTDRP
jgi:hypothetical protein